MTDAVASKNCILINTDIEACYNENYDFFSSRRRVGFLRDDFLLEDAKAAIAEAYVSENEAKTLILAAKSYNVYSQNALLKVLEEPPENIHFVIVAPTKSALLPTIRSRLPILSTAQHKHYMNLELSLKNLDLNAIFTFIQTLKRPSKHETLELIENILYQATAVEKLKLSSEQLDMFDKSYKLIHLNARAQTVLLTLLGTFLPKR